MADSVAQARQPRVPDQPLDDNGDPLQNDNPDEETNGHADVQVKLSRCHALDILNTLVSALALSPCPLTRSGLSCGSEGVHG